MQFHLETDELNLLANVLLQRVGATSAQASSASRLKSDSNSEQAPRRYDELLDKVLVRDLRFDADELEQVGDLLASEKSSLRDAVCLQPNAYRKIELQRKLATAGTGTREDRRGRRDGLKTVPASAALSEEEKS